MIPILPILGAVMQFAPDVIDAFKGDKPAADKMLDVAGGIAKKLTGKDNEDAAVEALAADPALQLEFRKALMEDKHVAEKMRYADIADARGMYKHSHTQQDKIATSVMRNNLWLVAILVALDGAVAMYAPPELMAVATGIGTLIGMVINALLKERQDVIGFFFGSSIGSKLSRADGK